MQKIIDINLTHKVWDDPSVWAEEQLSGLQVEFKITKSDNILESSEGPIQHYFPEYRDIVLYDHLGDSVFSAVLAPPEGIGKKYLKTLISKGTLGSEKIQRDNGPVRLVLTDSIILSGIDMSKFHFQERRIYLESLASIFIAKSAIPSIMISDVIKKDLKPFYEFITNLGARGVILKNSRGMLWETLFKIPSNKDCKGVGNVTLSRDWKNLEKTIEPLEVLDYDTYLAIQLLNKPSSEKILAVN